MVQQRDELEANKELTEQRLDRAQKLIVLTAGEAIRWKETVTRLASEIENLFGDVFLSTAQISYNGPFTGLYRHELMENWLGLIKDHGIPTSEHYNLVKTMGDPMLLREWIMQGLPSDQVS